MRVFLARPNSPMVVAPVPLGLGCLSYALMTRRGDVSRIVDGRRFRLGHDAIVSKAKRFGADVVGVTAMTFEAPEAIELISCFKRALPAVPVIIGGPHATGFGPGLLERCEADYLVMGEGEDTLVELLDAMEGKKEVAAVKGLARRGDQGVVTTEPRPNLEEVDSLGIDWEGMRPRDYFSSWRRNALNTIARSSRRLPVSFSRGCPFGCAYCHQIFGRKYRPFPIEKAVAEMVELKARYGVGEFEVLDDTFNLKLDRAKQIMEAVIAADLDVGLTFTNGLRADRMDEELLGLMKRAGTYRIDYAIETTSPRLQKLARKNLDLERAREVVNLTARAGIVTGCYYMLGFPGETAPEMEATVDYARSLANHISSFFYLMPFPGTAIAESDPEISRTVRDMNFRDASGVALNLSAASGPTMKAIRKRAYRGFYFSGPRLVRIARDVPKNLRLLASALAVLRLSFQENVNY